MMDDTRRPTPEAPATSVQPLALAELDAGLTVANAPRRLLDGEGAILSTLQHLKIRVTVQVGGTDLTVGELLGASAQQILKLDRTLEQPVEVLLEGQVVARGMLVAVDDHFGVRITEVAAKLDRSPASPPKG